MKIDASTSMRLRMVGFLYALIVVLIHGQSIRLWLEGDTVGYDWLFYARVDAVIRLFLSYTFALIAVPFFFVLSGFFLAVDEKDWVQNIRSWMVAL